MEWPGAPYDPVVLPTARPGRDRGRLASEHMMRQPVQYYQDPNGLLVPTPGPGLGGIHRSASVAGSHRRPVQIDIHNEFPNHEVLRSPHGRRRHSSHGHDYPYDSYSEEEYEHSPHPHRRRRGHRSPSRSPSPYYDAEYERKMRKLEELEKKEEEDQARERYEEEMLLKEAKRQKKKEEEEKLKKRAIEEYHIKQMEEKEKKEKAKEEADKEFKKRVKETFGEAGYDEESIEKILKKSQKGHGKEKQKVVDLARPTFLKVHRKHIDPLTLDEYELPWAWDSVCIRPSNSKWRFCKDRLTWFSARRRLHPDSKMDTRARPTNSL